MNQSSLGEEPVILTARRSVFKLVFLPGLNKNTYTECILFALVSARIICKAKSLGYYHGNQVLHNTTGGEEEDSCM